MSAPKDRWDKVGVFMHPVGGLLTAISVAVVGLAGSQVIDRQQAKSTDARLYSELMSQRELAESTLRKDMLVSVIQSYLAPKAGAVDAADAHLLQLELLAYNFHDSLNLKPLFVDLSRQLRRRHDLEAEEQYHRLKRIAREIADRQRFALEQHGESFRRTIDFQELSAAGGAGLTLDPATVTVNGVHSDIKLRALRAYPSLETVLVRMEVNAGAATPDKATEVTRTEFEVGYFDFPMIDSTHLTNGQRCAVVLSAFGQQTAELTTVCFPGEYASLKDRPYYDEVVDQLRSRGETP